MDEESVYEALRGEVAGMDEQVRTGALAALALKMARSVDSRPAAVMCAELANVINRLRELSPPKPVEDEVEAMRKRVGSSRASA